MAVPSRPRARARAHALLVVGTLLLAACGGQPAEPSAAEPAPHAEQPAAAAPDGNLTDGCVERYRDGVDYFPQQVAFEHTSGVAVTYAEHYKVVELASPAGPDAPPLRYVLLQCGTPAPPLEGELAGAQVVEVPVGEVVSLTTANLPHFDELKAVDALVGVGTAAFVSTPAVLDRVATGAIGSYADANGQPELERLIARDPDLLIVDGFGDAVLDDVGRTIGAGVPTVVNTDFNEQSLLGRAEWLKYSALFLNAEGEANAAFDRITSAYEEVAAKAAQVQERPSVLVNTPFEGTWYMPGGASYLANAIADAGGDYIFAQDESTGSLELDFETVLDRGGDADVWLQAGSVNGDLDDLLAQDERFAEFAAFQAGEVWAYDKWVTPGGGNAVFELAYTRADLFLSDLVAILHPDVLPDHELVFFGKVGAEPAS